MNQIKSDDIDFLLDASGRAIRSIGIIFSFSIMLMGLCALFGIPELANYVAEVALILMGYVSLSCFFPKKEK